MRKHHNPDVVYVIESFDPGQDEFEGRVVYEVLPNCEYFAVSNRQEFFEIESRIFFNFADRKGKMTAMPFFYFSFHGDEEGIEFSSGETASWDEVLILMNAVHDSVLGVAVSSGKWEIPRFTALCSICNSFLPIAEKAKNDRVPFQSWIAPVDEIKPIEALDSFIAFIQAARAKETRPFSELVDEVNAQFSVKLGMATFWDRSKPAEKKS